MGQGQRKAFPPHPSLPLARGMLLRSSQQLPGLLVLIGVSSPFLGILGFHFWIQQPVDHSRSSYEDGTGFVICWFCREQMVYLAGHVLRTDAEEKQHAKSVLHTSAINPVRHLSGPFAGRCEKRGLSWGSAWCRFRKQPQWAYPHITLDFAVVSRLGNFKCQFKVCIVSKYY